MIQDIIMPQLGQAMTRGQIVEWQAETGDQVAAGTHLLTIESDKFTYEIEAPASGLLLQLVEAGAEVEVGVLLGRIGDTLEQAEQASSRQSLAAPPVAAPAIQDHPASRHSGVEASPKAKALAGGRINLEEIAPSRADGLIVAADVEAALSARRKPASGAGGGAMERLQRSWQQAPHFVQMVDVDATALVEAQVLRKAGRFPATLNDILVHVAAQALARFPDINSHIAGGERVLNGSIDISLAVATERGLRTPMVHDAGGKPLDWIADKSRLAIAAAREGKASGGRASLTISNLGAHGVRQGTPVLNLDEAVLLFVGAISDQPAVRNGSVIVRPQMTLSIAYDHRVVDGLQAAQFTAALRDGLEQLDLSPWRGPPEGESSAHRLVTAISERGLRCDLSSGRHRWSIDEPAPIGGDDTAADPVLHMLGALLSCLTIAFKIVAARRGVPVERIAGEVSATPATGKVKQIVIRLSVWSPAEAAAIEGLLKPAKAACYVHDLLRPDLDLAVELSVNPGEAPS